MYRSGPTCKYSSEIQAVHFASNQHQATPHTGVLHVGGVEEHVYPATISPSKEEAPAAIWTSVPYTWSSQVTMVYFFSDGPCTQYIQKGNFYLSCTKLQECGFQSGTWNFFEASHRKGAPDGVSHGKDIPNAELLVKVLVDAQTSVKLFYICEDSIDAAV